MSAESHGQGKTAASRSTVKQIAVETVFAQHRLELATAIQATETESALNSNSLAQATAQTMESAKNLLG